MVLPLTAVKFGGKFLVSYMLLCALFDKQLCSLHSVGDEGDFFLFVCFICVQQQWER